MAASGIGEWMASAFIAKLVGKMYSYIEDQYEYQRDDAKEKLTRIKNSLWKIQAVLHKAESLQTKDPSMGSWLRSIKEAAYNAENVLDLFDYRVLEAKEEETRKLRAESFHYDAVGSSTSTTTRTTITTASTTSSSSSTVKRSVLVLKRLLFSDGDLNNLITVVDKFDKISIEMQIFLDLVRPGERRAGQSVKWRRTTSMLGTKNFFGRVGEETELKKLLIQTNDKSSQPFSVISIVGVAGVGKTALLQRVYSHFRDTGHFDIMAWLYVSEKLRVKRLTKEMVQSETCHTLKRKINGTRTTWHGSISADLNSISNLDLVQRKLQDKVKGRRILVVLDDVWDVKVSEWETLCMPLQFASNGSKVVLTTRNQKVAIINGATEIMHLDGLKDEDYWGHFKQCAFGNAIPADFPHLEKIGQLVAKKLAGSPLAAKTVGGKLKLKLHEKHWRGILGRKLWQIEQKEDDIIPALRLSYERLPHHLKQCLVYFALFPKNYKLQRDMLIQMWRAHGYIDKETRDEDAYSSIDELLQLSFIQKAANLDNHYVVHDLLHDFAEWVSNGEHYRIENDFQVGIPENVRHLYVNVINLSKVLISLKQSEVKKNLRSLIICKPDAASWEGRHPYSIESGLQETLHLQDLRSLRVLVLHHPDGIRPENMEHLVHLRYLDISEIGTITKFPKSIFKLYHIQALILQLQHQGETETLFQGIVRLLQQGINRLTQLRYLKVPPEIMSGIELIGRLTFLQKLEEYQVNSGNKHSISQLKELNQLRGKLTIKNLENVRCKEESYEARLFNKQNLKKLSLCWNHMKWGNGNTTHEGVFEGLQPNGNLRELHVTSYMGTTSPTWLVREYLPNIQTIELVSCHHWKTLPPFGSLPFLRLLKIRHFKAVERIDARFYGDAAVAFPSLEELLFDNMEQWKQWLGIESCRSLFPHLRNVRIKDCRQLMGPLPLPVSSNGISVSVSDWLSTNIVSTECDTNITYSEKSFSIQLFLDRFGLLVDCLPTSSLANIHVLELSSYHRVSFNKEEEWLQKLISVNEIRFNDCRKLISLPSNLAHLASLQSVYIEKCPELMSFPEMGLPLSLRKLSIIRCHHDLLTSVPRRHRKFVIHKDIKRESKLSNAKKRKWVSS